MTDGFGYRFKVTQKSTNLAIGTGFFKTTTELDEQQQLAFFHQYTSGVYRCWAGTHTIEIVPANQ